MATRKRKSPSEQLAALRGQTLPPVSAFPQGAGPLSRTPQIAPGGTRLPSGAISLGPQSALPSEVEFQKQSALAGRIPAEQRPAFIADQAKTRLQTGSAERLQAMRGESERAAAQTRAAGNIAMAEANATGKETAGITKLLENADLNIEGLRKHLLSVTDPAQKKEAVSALRDASRERKRIAGMLNLGDATPPSDKGSPVGVKRDAAGNPVQYVYADGTIEDA